MSEVPLYTLKRGDRRAACRRAAIQSPRLQGQLAHKKTHPPKTLPQAYAQGPRVVLGGWAVSYVRGTPLEGRIPAGDSFSKPNAQVSPCLAGVFDNFPSLTDAQRRHARQLSLKASSLTLDPQTSSLEPRASKLNANDARQRCDAQRLSLPSEYGTHAVHAQILALLFREKSLDPFNSCPLRWEAEA